MFACTYGERFMATFCVFFFVVVVVVFLGLWEEVLACAWCLRVHIFACVCSMYMRVRLCASVLGCV